MFWQSVWKGLLVLAHWEVLLALIVFWLLSYGWLAIGPLLMRNKNSAAGQDIGYAIYTLGGTLYNALILAFVVIAITPIMLGGDDFMPLSTMLSLTWPIILATLSALLAVFVLTALPVIGGLVVYTPGLIQFIEGLIIFRLFSSYFIDKILEDGGLPSLVYPPFWSIIGYFLIALVIIYVVMFGLAALGSPIRHIKYDDESTAGILVGTAAVRALALLPLFMYSSNVALAIQKLAG